MRQNAGDEMLKRLATGAAAGFVGTLAMSATMAVLQRLLPRSHREPYEPRQVVEGLLEKTALDNAVDEPEKSALTYVSHLGYGVVTGAMFDACADQIPFPRGIRGPAWGLAVWGASYCGWLPAFDILPGAHRRPAGRNALMIAAHLVWGATTEAASELFRKREKGIRHGEIWSCRQERSEKSSQETEKRDATQRQEGQGQISQASDRNRSLEGEEERRQSSQEEKGFEEKEVTT